MVCSKNIEEVEAKRVLPPRRACMAQPVGSRQGQRSARTLSVVLERLKLPPSNQPQPRRVTRGAQRTRNGTTNAVNHRNDTPIVDMNARMMRMRLEYQRDRAMHKRAIYHKKLELLELEIAMAERELALVQ